MTGSDPISQWIQSEEYVARINERLMQLFDLGARHKWLTRPNIYLNGKTPEACMNAGQYRRVLSALDAFETNSDGSLM